MISCGAELDAPDDDDDDDADVLALFLLGAPFAMALAEEEEEPFRSRFIRQSVRHENAT